MILPATFRALAVPVFRRYWAVQLVSQLGTWMRLIAASWLVLVELSGSATAVGLIAAAQFAPTLALGAWAGVLADRHPPLRTLRITQSAMVAVDAVLVVLVVAGWIEVWSVFVLTAAGGVVMAIDQPSRQAVVSELVPVGLVPNAIALNSVGFNGARVIGPAIAGGLIELAGTALCFAIDAASYVVALGGLFTIHDSHLQHRERAARAPRQIRSGLRYALGQPVLRLTLTAMAIVGIAAMNFTVFVPLLSRMFTDSAGSFGLLSAAMGVGSLAGAVFVARQERPSLRRLGRAGFALAVSMAAVAAAPGLLAGAIALAATGLCLMMWLSTTNSLIQTHTEPAMRGRVIALYLVLVAGTSPIGSPIVGWIAEQFGTRVSVAVGALGALAGALVVTTSGSAPDSGSTRPDVRWPAATEPLA